MIAVWMPVTIHICTDAARESADTLQEAGTPKEQPPRKLSGKRTAHRRVTIWKACPDKSGNAPKE
jgi:hypothetical protein